jgi:mannose-6-phosphate isomerase-like protein (cupin superfamily)
MATPKTRYPDIAPFITKDGSIIRELMHPAVHGNRNQSLAEAIVPMGEQTRPHRHLRSEELYHFTRGSGVMRLGESSFPVQAGDTVHIAPGTVHALANTGEEELRLLCCSAPPYADEDTELLGPPGEPPR